MAYASAPPGLRLLPEHVALYLQELPRVRHQLYGSVLYTGLEAYDHLVLIADLRGDMGRRLAEKSAPDWPLDARFEEAERLDLIPACCHVEPIHEAVAAAGIENDYIVQQIQLRPAVTTPIVVIDHADVVALTWTVLDVWGSEA